MGTFLGSDRRRWGLITQHFVLLPGESCTGSGRSASLHGRCLDPIAAHATLEDHTAGALQTLLFHITAIRLLNRDAFRALATLRRVLSFIHLLLEHPLVVTRDLWLILA